GRGLRGGRGTGRGTGGRRGSRTGGRAAGGGVGAVRRRRLALLLLKAAGGEGEAVDRIVQLAGNIQRAPVGGAEVLAALVFQQQGGHAQFVIQIVEGAQQHLDAPVVDEVGVGAKAHVDAGAAAGQI